MKQYIKAQNHLNFLIAGLVLICPLIKSYAQLPQDWPTTYREWWYYQGVIDDTKVDSPQNYSPLNQGQLLWFADRGIKELNEQLGPIGGAGFTLADLRDSNATTNYYAPVNLGQLKYTSAKFFDRFSAVGFTPGAAGWPSSIVLNDTSPGVTDNSIGYPWLDDKTAANYTPVNLGQMKHLFSWSIRSWVAVDSEDSGVGDGLPDYWEYYWFGDLSNNASGDNDTDGFTNAQELNQLSDPTSYSRQILGDAVDVKLNWGGQETLNLELLNPNFNTVNYTVSVSSNVALGYTLEDSLTGGAIYSWTDISSSGGELTDIADVDNDSEQVTLTGWTFPFYGREYSDIWVTSNGYIEFGDSNQDSTNEPLPDLGYPYAVIAAFWDDLNTSAGGTIYYLEELDPTGATPDKLTIQYEGVFRDGQSLSNTFQIVLSEDGTINFYYEDMNGTLDSATVGIENYYGNQGIEVAYNESYIQDQLAVTISLNQSKAFYSLSPSSGDLDSLESDTIALALDKENVIPGVYTSTVSISHDGYGNSPITVPIQIEIPYAKMTQPESGYTIWQGEILNSSSNRLEALVTDAPDFVDRVEFRYGSSMIGSDDYSSNDIYSLTFDSDPVLMEPGKLITEINVFARVVLDDTSTNDSAPLPIQIIRDEDGDRMPDYWEEQYLGGNINSAPLNDLDGDGFPNIFEYHHGSDPGDPTSKPFFDVGFETTQETASPAHDIENVYYYQVDANFSVETAYQKKSIQSALNFARDFDVIEVLPGTYSEDIDVNYRVYLFSRDGARTTIIDGFNEPDSVIDLRSESVVDGFTIQNGGASYPIYSGAGIYVDLGGADQKARVIGCLIMNNTTNDNGGAICVDSSQLDLVSCTIINRAPHSIFVSR